MPVIQLAPNNANTEYQGSRRSWARSLFMAGASLSVASLAFTPGAVHADITTFNYSVDLGGDSIAIPTLKAEISDTGTVNQVRINLTATGNSPSAAEVGFNLDPYTNVASSPPIIGLQAPGENKINIPPSPAGDGFDLRIITAFDAGSSTRSYLITQITDPPKAFSSASFNTVNAEALYSVAAFGYSNALGNQPCQGGVLSVCSRSIAANRSRRSIPGPLPILGAAMAFSYSRRIRTRLRDLQSQR
jgi:hypothetical protein